MTLLPVLAHSWGWDEIAYFAVPVGLALLWIRWIEKRAKAHKDTASAADAAGEGQEPAATMTRPDPS